MADLPPKWAANNSVILLVNGGVISQQKRQPWSGCSGGGGSELSRLNNIQIEYAAHFLLLLLPYLLGSHRHR